jgi:hypothetical protein
MEEQKLTREQEIAKLQAKVAGKEEVLKATRKQILNSVIEIYNASFGLDNDRKITQPIDFKARNQDVAKLPGLINKLVGLNKKKTTQFDRILNIFKLDISADNNKNNLEEAGAIKKKLEEILLNGEKFAKAFGSFSEFFDKALNDKLQEFPKLNFDKGDLEIVPSFLEAYSFHNTSLNNSQTTELFNPSEQIAQINKAVKAKVMGEIIALEKNNSLNGIYKIKGEEGQHLKFLHGLNSAVLFMDAQLKAFDKKSGDIGNHLLRLYLSQVHEKNPENSVYDYLVKATEDYNDKKSSNPQKMKEYRLMALNALFLQIEECKSVKKVTITPDLNALDGQISSYNKDLEEFKENKSRLERLQPQKKGQPTPQISTVDPTAPATVKPVETQKNNEELVTAIENKIKEVHGLTDGREASKIKVKEYLVKELEALGVTLNDHPKHAESVAEIIELDLKAIFKKISGEEKDAKKYSQQNPSNSAANNIPREVREFSPLLAVAAFAKDSLGSLTTEYAIKAGGGNLESVRGALAEKAQNIFTPQQRNNPL